MKNCWEHSIFWGCLVEWPSEKKSTELFESNRPAIVFGVEEKVHGDNGDAHSDHHEDDENEEHEAIHVVDLVRPERGEDEVHLYED